MIDFIFISATLACYSLTVYYSIKSINYARKKLGIKSKDIRKVFSFFVGRKKIENIIHSYNAEEISMKEINLFISYRRKSRIFAFLFPIMVLATAIVVNLN